MVAMAHYRVEEQRPQCEHPQRHFAVNSCLLGVAPGARPCWPSPHCCLACLYLTPELFYHRILTFLSRVASHVMVGVHRINLAFTRPDSHHHLTDDDSNTFPPFRRLIIPPCPHFFGFPFPSPCTPGLRDPWHRVVRRRQKYTGFFTTSCFIMRFFMTRQTL